MTIRWLIYLLIFAFLSCKGDRKTDLESVDLSKEFEKNDSTEIDCNKWNRRIVKKEEGEDSLGWFKNHEDYWIDTTRGEEFKYNLWPPNHEEKYYYTNFTIYIDFDLNSTIESPNERLKVMVKDSSQNLVKWLYPLNDSKFLVGKSIGDSKVLDRGNREIVLQTDFGILSYTCYQVGDLLCVNIFNDEGGETIIYNLKGEVVYSKLGLRPSAMLSVSKDSRFVAIQNGGISSEDGIILPIEAIVYDLKLKKYVLNFRSEKQCLNSGIFLDSDWFTLVLESCTPQITEELFVCNLSEGKVYKLNLEDISGFRMKICPEFELIAVGKNFRKQVYLDKDFTELDGWPF